MPVARAVNFHLLRNCNAKCRFCFATFRDADHRLPSEDARQIVKLVREAGAEKITFVGGEPTLYPSIDALARFSKEIGFVTSIVTNGAKLRKLLANCEGALDWVGLSIDSASDEVNRELGRGDHGYVEQTVELAELSRTCGARVKMNTVVTSLNAYEDMSELVRRIRPDRWKVFQVLPVVGQNDGSVEPLLVTSTEFVAFVRRHENLAAEDLAPVAEDNDAMTDSYAMIDPLGRFFGNTAGQHCVSRPILDVGVEAAIGDVGFADAKLIARGGIYDWDSVKLPIAR